MIAAKRDVDGYLEASRGFMGGDLRNTSWPGYLGVISSRSKQNCFMCLELCGSCRCLHGKTS